MSVSPAHGLTDETNLQETYKATLLLTASARPVKVKGQGGRAEWRQKPIINVTQKYFQFVAQTCKTESPIQRGELLSYSDQDMQENYHVLVIRTSRKIIIIMS